MLRGCALDRGRHRGRLTGRLVPVDPQTHASPRAMHSLTLLSGHVKTSSVSGLGASDQRSIAMTSFPYPMSKALSLWAISGFKHASPRKQALRTHLYPCHCPVPSSPADSSAADPKFQSRPPRPPAAMFAAPAPSQAPEADACSRALEAAADS